MVKHLIYLVTCSWNVDLLNAYIYPDDVKIVKGLAISRSQRPDTYGWMFNDFGKYSVKSGFRTESSYLDRGQTPISYGPNIKPLLAHSWKLKCSPKSKHFVWQILSGTLPVAKNLKSCGIDCDLRWSICGAEEETTNHVLFECLPALKTWFLSRIPSNMCIFPASSFLLVWIIYFGDFWKMRYIWNNINEKICINKNRNLQEILRIAEVKGTL